MKVLISGAGIAGPTLAHFLARASSSVTVLERTPSIGPHGQNIDIRGAAITIIKKMGLLDEVRKYNTTETGGRFVNSKGKAIADFPIGEDGKGASVTAEFEILRGDLAKVLYEGTKNDANIEYRFSTTIKEVLSNDDKSVKVLLSDGQTEEYDVLVAADGQWSKVRRQCFPESDVTLLDKNMRVVYFTIPKTADDNTWCNIYLGLGKRVLTLRPDPHGTTRAMFSCMPNSPESSKEWLEAVRKDRKAQEELTRKHFADAGWQAERMLGAMSDSPDFYLQLIQQIRMKKWSTGRVICIGDAAFCPTPLTGMGTSLAIDSAYVLAGELSKLQEEGQHPGQAFEAYEKAFRPFVQKTCDIPSFVPGIAHYNSSIARSGTFVLLRTLSRIVNSSIVRNRFSKSEDEIDYVLPAYPRLS